MYSVPAGTLACVRAEAGRGVGIGHDPFRNRFGVEPESLMEARFGLRTITFKSGRVVRTRIFVPDDVTSTSVVEARNTGRFNGYFPVHEEIS